MRTAVALAVIVLAASAIGAQTPLRDQPRVIFVGSAVVSGVVVADDETRAPLRNAIVTLSRNGVEDIRTTPTDEQGRFSFDRLPPGSFTLHAAKGGYITMSYGAPKPGMPGSVVTVVDGQTFAARPIALTRGAVIAGRLLDRNGLPVAGAPIDVLPFVVVNGERRLRRGLRLGDSTNAHGEYRIHGLPPGQYIVVSDFSLVPIQGEPSASAIGWANRATGQAPPAARAFSYAPTVFPGTTNAAAGTVITLSRGEERLGVDFSRQLVPVASVSGVMTLPDGRPHPEGGLFCYLKEPSAMLPQRFVPFSRVGADGSFLCSGLPPGQYTIVARGADQAALSQAQQDAVRQGLALPPLWGFVDVAVTGQDISNVAIRLQNGMSLSGQILLKTADTTTRVDLTRFQIRLTPGVGVARFAGAPMAPVSADGTFQIDGIVPGDYRVNVTAPPGPWSLGSVMLGGKDVADVPFDVASGQPSSGLVVTFSDAQTELSGGLTDSEGRVASQLYVFVFPADKAMWLPSARRIRSVRSTDSGSYSIAGLPAGEYYLCALTELDTMLQFEAEYLNQLIPDSFKITLADGEKKIQNLRVGR